MEFEIEGRCVVKLEHKQGEQTSKHVTTDFNLDVSKNVDRSHFLDKEDLPTAAGTTALTQCFVQGLVGNIHNAHEKGYWDSAEHLRYIIAELERGFSSVANVYESNFKS
jgi:hypothetical protein